MTTRKEKSNKEKLLEFIHNLTTEECEKIIAYLNNEQKEQA